MVQAGPAQRRQHREGEAVPILVSGGEKKDILIADILIVSEGFFDHSIPLPSSFL